MSADPAPSVEHALFVRTIMNVQTPTRVVSQMAARMQDHTFPRDATIFERGAQGHSIYFVSDGVVALEAPDMPAWTFERGSMIGIMDAIQDRPHARTARTKTRAHLVSIECDDYFDIMEDNFDFTKTRIESTMQAIHRQSLKLEPPRIFSQLNLRGREPLPVEFDIELTEMRRLMVLRDTSLFEHAPVQPLVDLALSANVEHFAPGTQIFSVGSPAEHVYVVAGGAVELTAPEYRVTFEAGGLLGGLAAFGFTQHPHRAVAVEPTTILAMRKEDLYDVMEDHFGLVRRLFTWLSVENERTREILAERSS